MLPPVFATNFQRKLGVTRMKSGGNRDIVKIIRGCWNDEVYIQHVEKYPAGTAEVPNKSSRSEGSTAKLTSRVVQHQDSKARSQGEKGDFPEVYEKCNWNNWGFPKNEEPHVGVINGWSSLGWWKELRLWESLWAWETSSMKEMNKQMSEKTSKVKE